MYLDGFEVEYAIDSYHYDQDGRSESSFIQQVEKNNYVVYSNELYDFLYHVRFWISSNCRCRWGFEYSPQTADFPGASAGVTSQTNKRSTAKLESQIWLSDFP